MSTPSINKSLIPFLVKGTNVKGIRAIYDEDAYKRGSETPKFYKSTDDNVQVGDIVIVPAGTRLGFTTNKVVETDVTPDFNWKQEIEWIVGSVNTKKYDDCLEFEKKVMKGFQSAEQKRLQEEMRAQLDEVMQGIEMPSLPSLPGTSEPTE